MSQKNKQSLPKDMPSGINIMGMGGTGEELDQSSGSVASSEQPGTSSKKLMKGNAQKGS